jgi:Alternate to MurJ
MMHMDTQLAIICFLTVVIHLIGTLAYSAPLTGVRTRRIAVSFALFNVLVLMEGRPSESPFRRALVWLVGSRFAGTLLAQLLLAPSAGLIVLVAQKL